MDYFVNPVRNCENLNNVCEQSYSHVFKSEILLKIEYGILNHPEPSEKGFPTHVCYPKDWTDTKICKFICDTQQWDQIILKSEKEIIWRCIPIEIEFWCEFTIFTIITYFFILLSFGLFFLAIFFLSWQGIELLANRYLLFGTWTAPQPVNGPILPQPAPAG